MEDTRQLPPTRKSPRAEASDHGDKDVPVAEETTVESAEPSSKEGGDTVVQFASGTGETNTAAEVTGEPASGEEEDIVDGDGDSENNDEDDGDSESGGSEDNDSDDTEDENDSLIALASAKSDISLVGFPSDSEHRAFMRHVKADMADRQHDAERRRSSFLERSLTALERSQLVASRRASRRQSQITVNADLADDA